MEKVVEKLMYRSRWLLAPIYLGLSLALLALAIKFFHELFHLTFEIWRLNETDMVLIVLKLIDLAMVGGLLVMVMMSGYENFVSRLDIGEGEEKLSWLGKMDSSSLKAKIAASIVAISSIHLLKVFMGIHEDYAGIETAIQNEINNDKIRWFVVTHLTFVASAFAMGSLDNLIKPPGKN